MYKCTKIFKGYYQLADQKGRIWFIEHVTTNDGFTYDEWHVGTEDDPHADQYNTKRECVEAIIGFNEDGY